MKCFCLPRSFKHLTLKNGGTEQERQHICVCLFCLCMCVYVPCPHVCRPIGIHTYVVVTRIHGNFLLIRVKVQRIQCITLEHFLTTHLRTQSYTEFPFNTLWKVKYINYFHSFKNHTSDNRGMNKNVFLPTVIERTQQVRNNSWRE